jgi:hypothetical protein
MRTMPEENDIDKNVYKVEKKKEQEDLLEGIESHAESERSEEREGGPASVDRAGKGPYVRSCLYTCEDTEVEEEKRHPPK